jgi:membrane protein YqaA with SNARE-associated domain
VQELCCEGDKRSDFEASYSELMTRTSNIWQATLAVALQAAKKKKAATPSATFNFVRHFGGVALVPLAIVDSTIIPTFGSLDLLTAWLAAGNPDLWWYYAVMSTAGSLIGAFITYRMGKKMGAPWIEKKIGAARLRRVKNALERHGAGSIFVATIAPPPFPTAWFFLGAGAFSMPLRKFFASALLGRALRYGLLTSVAAHYGRHFLRYLRHPMHYLLISLIVSASLIAASFLFAIKRKPELQPSASGGN